MILLVSQPKYFSSDATYQADLTTAHGQPKWKFRGFRNASGGRVANMDLVLQLEIQFNKRRGNVKWKQVKSHSGIRGNEWADR